jgi:hypothetical protein
MIAAAERYRSAVPEFEAVRGLTWATAAVDDAMDSLDDLLEETCLELCTLKFTPAKYRGLLEAYDKLHQLPILQHKLQHHFDMKVMTVAISTLFALSTHRTHSGRDIVPALQPQAAGSRNVKSTLFIEIAKQLKPNQVFQAAMKLYSELLAVMASVFSFVQWHARRDNLLAQGKEVPPIDVSPSSLSAIADGLGAIRAYLFQRIMGVLGDFVDNIKATTTSVWAAEKCCCCPNARLLPSSLSTVRYG